MKTLETAVSQLTTVGIKAKVGIKSRTVRINGIVSVGFKHSTETITGLVLKRDRIVSSEVVGDTVVFNMKQGSMRQGFISYTMVISK